MTIYKPRCIASLDVPIATGAKIGTPDEFQSFTVQPISVTWSRNNHLEADALTLVLDWSESGLDPRMLKSARVAFWLWDAEAEPDFDPGQVEPAFSGIAVKSERDMSAGAVTVTITAHDYTSFFINCKPFPSTGIPEYSDTLRVAWARICLNTGWYDAEKKTIVSSVEVLEDNLVCTPPDIADEIVGRVVPERFHKIAKPQIRDGSSAWDAWNWIVTSLGYYTWISGDKCYVSNGEQYYDESNPPVFKWGLNIHELKEEADCTVSQKGILCQSYDAITGRTIEGFYPPIGDARIKSARAAAAKDGRSKTPQGVSANDTSGDYIPFVMHSVTSVEALERIAEYAYNERSRQEVQGSFRTSEMRVTTERGDVVDIARKLQAGDPVVVGITDDISELDPTLPFEEKVLKLQQALGYSRAAAEVAVKNFQASQIYKRLYHVKSVEIKLNPDSYDCTISYHNLINLSKP